MLVTSYLKGWGGRMLVWALCIPAPHPRLPVLGKRDKGEPINQKLFEEGGEHGVERSSRLCPGRNDCHLLALC